MAAWEATLEDIRSYLGTKDQLALGGIHLRRTAAEPALHSSSSQPGAVKWRALLLLCSAWLCNRATICTGPDTGTEL